MKAAFFNVSPDITAMLLKAGANIAAKNNDGMTVLDFAHKESMLLETYKAQGLEKMKMENIISTINYYSIANTVKKQ